MATKAAVDPLIQKPYLMELAKAYLGDDAAAHAARLAAVLPTSRACRRC